MFLRGIIHPLRNSRYTYLQNTNKQSVVLSEYDKLLECIENFTVGHIDS
jgi:hypothetical protein